MKLLSRLLAAVTLATALVCCAPLRAEATTITVTSVSLSNYHPPAGQTVYLRVYVNSSFMTSDGTLLQASSPTSGRFYRQYACTLGAPDAGGNQSLTVASITLDSTIDSPDNKLASYSFYLYSSTGAMIGPVDGFGQVRVSNLLGSITWAQLRSYNTPSPLPAPPEQYYTKDQVLQLLLNTSYVPIAGGTMTGPLILSGDPTGALQAATKAYVDAHGGGSGTVTSVGLTVPSWLSVAGSPVTSSGTIAVTAAGAQTANRFLATPDGSTGAVALRAIAKGDLPAVTAYTDAANTFAAAQSISHTVTDTTPSLMITPTWNAPGVTVTGFKFNATDTSSAAGSWLYDWMVGGVSKGSLLKNGNAAFAGTLSLGAGPSVITSNATASRTVTLPDANSVTVVSSSAGANQFATGISGAGAISYAQPSFANLSGTASSGQLPATIVYTGQGNTYTTGAQDFGSATSLKVPVSAGAAPTTSGLIAYDSTANAWKAGTNGATRTFVLDTRTITAGTGLTGGGDLSADRTLSVAADTTNQRVKVQLAGSDVGTRPTINLIQGSNATLTVADNAGSNRVDVTIASSASAGSRWDQLTNATGALALSNAANNTSFSQTTGLWSFNWTGNTSTNSLFALTDATGNTGTGYILDVHSVGTSSISPMMVTAKGTSNGISVDNTGTLVAMGTGGIDAAGLSKNTVPLARLSGITTTQLSATAGIVNAQLANSSITINGTANQVNVSNTAPALGGTTTLSLPQSIHTAATPQFARMGFGGAAGATAIVTVAGPALNTDADATIALADLAFSVTKNDANVRQFYGWRLKPTFNTGGSNASTTVDLISVDTVNTVTTGLTVNLENLSYGGSSKWKVTSGGAGTLAASLAINGGTALTTTNQTGTGSLVLATSPTITTPTISGVVTWPSGTRQTFAPNGTTPGLNVGSNAGDPSTPSNGDLWYDSSGNLLRARINGATVSLGAGGGGSPGGSSGQFQYNNSSAFGGAVGLTYNTAASPTITVQAQNSAHVALSVRGATSNSTDIQRWRDPGDTTSYARIASDGSLLIANGGGTLSVNNTASGAAVGTFTNTAGASNSFGIAINAGTNSSDYALSVKAADTTTQLFKVRGDGLAIFSKAMAVGDGGTVASATTTALGVAGNYYVISGTTTITSITAVEAGRIVVLKFSGALTVTDGSNLLLAGNFVTTADDTLTLICDGTNWIEVSRSVN